LGEKDDKYLAPPEIFFAFPRLCWAGYGRGLMIKKCESFNSRK